MFIRLRTAECEWHTLYATRSRPRRCSPDTLSHRLSAVLGDHVKIFVASGREKLRDPSPVSPRLVKAPSASHPLPGGEGKVNSKDCRGGACGRDPSPVSPRPVKTPAAVHPLWPRRICDPWEKAGSVSGGFRPDLGGGPPSVAAADLQPLGEGWERERGLPPRSRRRSTLCGRGDRGVGFVWLLRRNPKAAASPRGQKRRSISPDPAGTEKRNPTCSGSRL
jgi:hypothetical protein